MADLIRYLSHPQVAIDRNNDVTKWGLNAVGGARVSALCEALGALVGTAHVVSSGEVKAVQTAQPLADALGVQLHIRPLMHENDRSATGFLEPDEFERVADQFFASPHVSVRGWERAADAQARIVREVDAVLAEHEAGDTLIVGHGGVGTLLYCALADVDIDRRFDQGPGGGGNWFAFDRLERRPLSGWRPLEELSLS